MSDARLTAGFDAALTGLVRDGGAEDVAGTLRRLAAVLAERAERVYDADPTRNGPAAQPFADAAGFVEAAADALEDKTESVWL